MNEVGRIGAADALWTPSFGAFCADEAGAIGWILSLEGVRGFAHVAEALRAWLAVRTGVEVARAPLHLGVEDCTGCTGEFAALHKALAALCVCMGRSDVRALQVAEDRVREAAPDLSAEATEALLARWKRTWRSAGLANRSGPGSARPTFWGGTADVYIGAGLSRLRTLSSPEAADREAWSSLHHPRREARGQVMAAAARLRRRILTPPVQA